MTKVYPEHKGTKAADEAAEHIMTITGSVEFITREPLAIPVSSTGSATAWSGTIAEGIGKYVEGVMRYAAEQQSALGKITLDMFEATQEFQRHRR